MRLAKKREDIKEAFYLICQQYNATGLFLRVMTEAATAEQMDVAMAVHQRFLDQYQEMGEQLKVLGTAIDRLGGTPIL